MHEINLFPINSGRARITDIQFIAKLFLCSFYASDKPLDGGIRHMNRRA